MHYAPFCLYGNKCDGTQCLECKNDIEISEQKSRADRIAELVAQGYTSGIEANFSWELTINEK